MRERVKGGGSERGEEKRERERGVEKRGRDRERYGARKGVCEREIGRERESEN